MKRKSLKTRKSYFHRGKEYVFLGYTGNTFGNSGEYMFETQLPTGKAIVHRNGKFVDELKEKK